MNTKMIHSITLGGILAAAIILLTTIVSIPIPGGLGYVHLGDAAVLIAASVLNMPWGVVCAGVASALSDLLLGYAIYIPGTFFIKSATAAMLILLQHIMPRKVCWLSYILAALCIPIGYLLYESLLYGMTSALPNLGFNTLQGMVGAVIAIIVERALKRFPFMNNQKNHC